VNITVVLAMQRAGASLRWRRSVSYSSRLRSRRAAELSSELCHWSINDIVKLTRQSAVRTVYKLSFCWKSPMIVEICSFKSLILPLNSTLPTEIQERKARGRAPCDVPVVVEGQITGSRSIQRKWNGIGDENSRLGEIQRRG
jgi:hypothetical protein